ncbi:hypothetical protein GGS20DRAFT_590161 [Poronia punctata]|nr:hypothetical protein GGS20DRAFT_590161 [Poronia punctata]
MHFSTFIAAALLGTVSALPEPEPVPAPAITAAPVLENEMLDTTAAPEKCTTDCWASYAPCHGTLTFVTLCFTPPPCGTKTSPDPYKCPPKTDFVENPTFQTYTKPAPAPTPSGAE